MSNTWECPFCFCMNGDHSERCEMKHAKTEPSAPTVHMNGTSWKELYEQYEKASSAIRDAMAAMQSAAPNGRDYYVHGQKAINTAQDEHWDRLKRMREIRAEIEYILMKISDQQTK